MWRVENSSKHDSKLKSVCNQFMDSHFKFGTPHIVVHFHVLTLKIFGKILHNYLQILPEIPQMSTTINHIRPF
jgi:hypothetical protein